MKPCNCSVSSMTKNNQTGRQTDWRGVTAPRQGQRITQGHLVHWQHPLNLSQWEDPQRAAGCLLRLIGSLKSTQVINWLACQSTCVSVCCRSVYPVCVCVCVRACVCVFRSVTAFIKGKTWIWKQMLRAAPLWKKIMLQLFRIQNTRRNKSLPVNCNVQNNRFSRFLCFCDRFCDLPEPYCD